MLSSELDRARLGSFFAHLLGKRDVRAYGQPAECPVEHAVAMKIDFMTIGRLQEPKLAGRVEGLHRRDRLIFVLLHLPLQTPNMILQPPSCMLEGIIDGEC